MQFAIRGIFATWYSKDRHIKLTKRKIYSENFHLYLNILFKIRQKSESWYTNITILHTNPIKKVGNSQYKKATFKG